MWACSSRPEKRRFTKLQGQEYSKASSCLCVLVFLFVHLWLVFKPMKTPNLLRNNGCRSPFVFPQWLWLGFFLHHKQKPGEHGHLRRGFGVHAVSCLFGEVASLWPNPLYLTCLARFPDVTEPRTSGTWPSVLLPANPGCHNWANPWLAFSKILSFLPNVVELQ